MSNGKVPTRLLLDTPPQHAESEARYRQLADAMPQLVWTSDSSGVVDYYNSRVSLYAGVEQHPDGSWIWAPVIHPDDLAATQAAWQTAQTGEIYEHEHRLRMHDGSYRWHLSRAQAIRNTDGQIVKWFGTATDIHERKQREEDTHYFAELVERLRISHDADTLAAAVVQSLGAYLQVTRCYLAEVDALHDRWSVRHEYAADLPSIVGDYRISDYPSELVELLRYGQSLVATDTKTDPRSATYYAHAFAPLGVQAYVMVPFLREGQWVSNLVVATHEPRSWEAREVALLETIAERTWLTIEQVRLNAALRERTTLLDAILEGTSELIYVKDRASRMLLSNPALERLLGHTADSLYGKNEYEHLPNPIDAATIIATDQRIMASEHGEVIEETVLTPQGRRVYLSNKTPWRDAHGNVIGLIGISTDITERKRVEAIDRFLYQLLDATRKITVPEEITATTAHLLGQYLGVDRCAYAETEPDENTFVITGDYTAHGTESIVGRYTMRAFGNEALRLMRSGQPFVVEDSTTDPRITSLQVYLATQITALICVPLHKEGHFVAGMAVHQRTPRRWTADEIELVQLVANLCWEAIARARSERALRSSEERYRSLVEATTSVVWMTDASGAFVEPQTEWEDYTGQAWDAHQGWGWIAMLHPDDREQIRVGWAAAVTAGKVYEGHGRVWHMESAAYRYFVARAAPVVDLTGKIREWIGTLTDIHPQRLAEQRAQRFAERTERLQQVTAGLSAALTPAQVAQVVVEQSVAALGAALGSLRMLTPNRTELIELHITDEATHTFWPRIPLTANSPITDTVRSGQPIWLESLNEIGAHYPTLVSRMQANGYAALASLPIIVDAHVLGTIALCFAQPRRFAPGDRALLQALAQQCGQALERARLYEAERQARTEAEAAVRYRDQFLSVAAHELRTPLTSLLGNAQLLQRRGLRTGGIPERDRQALDVIVAQASRLNKLVLVLLDIARLERGQLAIERIQIDLCALLQRIINEMQVSLEGRTIELACPDNPLVIQGDALRLEQVFQNLIQNALKYSAETTAVSVEITQHNNEAQVAIIDQGIGIPSDEQERLFQRFYRAENAERRKVSGMGIGLYVVKEIVTLHGGTVVVESVEGQGSTFHVSLPCKKADNINKGVILMREVAT